MKNSAKYRLAQYAVINSPSMQAETKAEILRELIAAEDLEIYREKQAEKKAQEEKANETV